MKRGLHWTLLLVATSVLPILFLRALVAHGYVTLPPIKALSGYLIWCVVQDFLFFSLVLRNLLDFVNRHVAIVATAGLFALSHYPFYTFMGGTALVAFCWGYVFATSRVIWFVIVAHWILGLMILM